MDINFFKKKNKNAGDKDELKKEKQDRVIRKESEEEIKFVGSAAFSGVGGVYAHKILRGFYISEKASMDNAAGQYVFKVFNTANKSEIKKEVSRLFDVKVKSVKVSNLPEKRRDFGKHPGTKPGFKKATVVLEKGYVIGQAKP